MASSTTEILQRTRFRAQRTHFITESVIREMSRLAARHNAVNLAQGFPDFAAPQVIKEAAQKAIGDDINQYAITWGAKPFRDAIAAKYRRYYGLEIDPEREITVCCGSTEGMIASLLAITNPSDEVIIFEPFYENFGPDTMLCAAERKFVPLYPTVDAAGQYSDWRFDPEELRRAFSPKTKAIIINSPGNPTGHVLDREQLAVIAELCQEYDAIAITDEIYEHILYDGARHIPMMTMPGMRERTLLINSMSKTYAVTGWRVGWVLGSADLTDSIRKVHDFLTVGAAAPLQAAGVVALGLPQSYYDDVALHYLERRDRMVGMLSRAGFRCSVPKGAYYVMANVRDFNRGGDIAFVRDLVERVGIAAVPGSSFFSDPAMGADWVRFCFPKKNETLDEAERRLARL